MGYTTDFTGSFKLDRKLSPEHLTYLKAFAETRRMKRASDVAETLEDPIRIAAGLPIGNQGEFFVGGGEYRGQEEDKSIIDYNLPPFTQPHLWCNWIPNENGTAIEWDGGEKFYAYVTWLQYIIDNFLDRWDYNINGTVYWQGEDPYDRGKIVVKDNIMEVFKGHTVYTCIKNKGIT